MQKDTRAESTSPPTPLWRLHRAGHAAACEILTRPCGYEGRFLYDGRFLYAYHFTRPDDAVAWASEREAQCRLAGWSAES
jgi:hypothetical protein